MKYVLTHIQDWLTVGGPVSGVEWLLLLMFLLAATVVFNIVTGSSDPLRMIGNFLFLLAGGSLSIVLFPDRLPSIDPVASFTLALFSGMTVAAMINIALFKPA
jgi:hypothetical protein